MILEVVTPGNGKKYEILLDDILTVGAAKEKIMEQIMEFENGNIAFDETVALYSPATQTRLSENRNIRKAGVRSGQLVLLL